MNLAFNSRNPLFFSAHFAMIANTLVLGFPQNWNLWRNRICFTELESMESVSQNWNLNVLNWLVMKQNQRTWLSTFHQHYRKSVSACFPTFPYNNKAIFFLITYHDRQLHLFSIVEDCSVSLSILPTALHNKTLAVDKFCAPDFFIKHGFCQTELTCMLSITEFQLIILNGVNVGQLKSSGGVRIGRLSSPILVIQGLAGRDTSPRSGCCRRIGGLRA